MPRTTKAADPLSQTLASGALARLVRFYAANPESAPHFRALQRMTGLRSRSLQVEVRRLLALGVIVREEEGSRVRFRLDERHPLWPALRQMVRLLSEPADVLPLALADVSGVEAAFVFGSFAKGTARPDSDVDLFVLGDQVDETSLSRHTLDAGVLLGREVNVVHLTRRELEERLRDGKRFFLDVLWGAKQWVAGSPDALGDLAAVPAQS